MRNSLIFLALLALVAGAGVARAESHCSTPMAQWQPREAIVAMATARGWTLTRIRVDDGCYALDGRDASGQAFGVRVDPGTLEILESEQDD